MSFRTFLACLLLFVVGAAVTPTLAEEPLLELGDGLVQGSTENARGGRVFYQFKGIPFGKVVERFQPSVPADKWSNVFNATAFGPVCAQFDCLNGEFTGEKECLNLNVFTPKLPKSGHLTKLYPVVVVLHLGGHFFGSAQQYNPHYVMDQDVVLVTPNSRLGPFGYLNTGDANAPGNVGLRDQSLALNWVRKNIHKFSGDWERVTLMGADSGGVDALLHLINPEDKGLFHRAVVMSSTINSCSFVKDPVIQAKKMGEQVGCPNSEKSDEFVKCLKKMEPLELLKKMKVPTADMSDFKAMQQIAIFGPSVDGKGGLLPKHPFEIIKSGKVPNNVPLIMGTTAMDGLDPASATFLNDTALYKKTIKDWIEDGPQILDFSDAQDPAGMAKQIFDFYSKDGTISSESFIDMFTDKQYEHFLRFISKHWDGVVPMYVYRFNHTETPNRAVDMIGYQNLPKGPGHWDDLQYLFNMSNSFMVPVTTGDSPPVEYILSKGMVRMWTSFFETGKPSAPWGEGEEWEQFHFDGNQPNKIYKVDVTPKIVRDTEAFQKRMEFWDAIYETFDVTNSA
ncbi:esterase E4 [Folsomia candida]|uniref:esterase E4 n=1 Tax=Folsomia candida TaxID=158441 RepID=UPI000B8EEEC1|nr:esterase E4 [Folsomia candida]